MAGQTTHYQLIKPTTEDDVLVNDLNTNAEIIDAALYAKPNIDDTAGDGNTSDTWSADKLVEELAGKLGTATIDDTAGDGDTGKVWSADKTTSELDLKVDVASIATVTETAEIISEYEG